jgi:RNA polymerase sigma factor (TIGR02999 family)
LTDLIAHAQQGDENAINRLFSWTYYELRKPARARLRGSRDVVLDTTSLVHEAYVRLADVGRLRLCDRLHFFSYASRAMRSLIVDLVRKRQAERHEIAGHETGNAPAICQPARLPAAAGRERRAGW